MPEETNYYITALEEKLADFKAKHGRLPSKILLTRAVFEALKLEAFHGESESIPCNMIDPEFGGIPIEIDDI